MSDDDYDLEMEAWYDANEKLQELRIEVASVLSLLDGLADQWGDEAVFRRCRDRLRKSIEEDKQ